MSNFCYVPISKAYVHRCLQSSKLLQTIRSIFRMSTLPVLMFGVGHNLGLIFMGMAKGKKIKNAFFACFRPQTNQSIKKDKIRGTKPLL